MITKILAIFAFVSGMVYLSAKIANFLNSLKQDKKESDDGDTKAPRVWPTLGLLCSAAVVALYSLALAAWMCKPQPMSPSVISLEPVVNFQFPESLRGLPMNPSLNTPYPETDGLTEAEKAAVTDKRREALMKDLEKYNQQNQP